MEKIRKELVPGTIVFFDGKNFISNAIQTCQTIYTKKKYGVKSKWSHIGLVGDDGRFHESTMGFNGLKLQDGIIHTDIDKRFTDKKIKENSKIGFLHSPEIDMRIRKITRWMLDNTHIKYGKIELFGVLWVMAKWKALMIAGKTKKAEELLNRENPVDSPQKIVCIAAVADAIESTGLDYIGIHSSVATVDEGWLGCLLPDVAKKIIRI